MSRNRGQPKLKLRDLSRLPPTKEEQDALLAAITSTTAPNATAILGAVFVEHELEVSLRRRFTRNDDDTWAAMLADNGPLSTFFAKIVTGYAFRLYDEPTMDNFHIVRNIRNAFAHSKKLISFDHELIVAELSKVNTPKGRNKKHFQSLKKGIEPKAAYVALRFLLTIDLLTKRGRATAAQTRKLNRRTMQKYPYAAGLMKLLAPALPKGFGGLGPLSYPPPRSGDPKASIPAGALSGLFQSPPKPDDNQDK